MIRVVGSNSCASAIADSYSNRNHALWLPVLFWHLEQREARRRLTLSSWLYIVEQLPEKCEKLKDCTNEAAQTHKQKICACELSSWRSILEYINNAESCQTQSGARERQTSGGKKNLGWMLTCETTRTICQLCWLRHTAVSESLFINYCSH